MSRLLFRSLLFLAALFVQRTAALADCNNSGIWLWPTSQTLAPDQVILITGYASSQEVIRQLGGKHRIYLSNGATRIEMTVLEVLEGQMRLTQALLRPSAPLAIGATYMLVIDGLPENQQPPSRWNSVTEKREACEWTVADPGPAAQPVLMSTPREYKKTLVHYGCGPAEFVYFQVAAVEHPDGLVRVSVIERGSPAPVAYILPMERGIVQIGHGMCSGAFLFQRDASYSVRFAAIDRTGAGSIPTRSVVFTPPVETTSGE